MKLQSGEIAVVTGGGAGIGRALVLELASRGMHVATCDVNPMALKSTLRAARGGHVSVHECDVSDEKQVEAFREDVLAHHDVAHVNLLINNAGVGRGGSFVKDDAAAWERTFDINWGGVYFCCRAFMPLLVAADHAHLVNVSSVNGFLARLAPGVPYTAYCAAKFAVKGFTEALIEDLRINAPHVGVSVAMPGHVGTDIMKNSREIHAGELTLRQKLYQWRRGRKGAFRSEKAFRTAAPTSPEETARAILAGVEANEWRILIGADAVELDKAVRADPVGVYGENGRSVFQ